MIIGILLAIIAGFLTNYLLDLSYFKENWDYLFPYEPVVISGVFITFFVIYYFLQKVKFTKLVNDLKILNSKIEVFNTEKKFNIETKNQFLVKTFTSLNNLFNEWLKKEANYQKKINNLQMEKDDIENIFDLENVFVLKVTESGKVSKSNKKFLEFLGFDSEAKLNINVQHIFDIFNDESLSKNLNDLIGKDIKVKMNNVNFLLHIEKIPQTSEYVITLIDITIFENEKNSVIQKMEYAGENLKTTFAINKKLETTMIKVLNYDSYFAYLGSGILEVFEEKFVEKIISLGYEDIFKIENNLFAVYDLHVNFDKYKKTLEETIIITVGKDKYIFTPKVVITSGVNFEQAYQQIAESSKTLVSKEKSSSKYELDFIKFVNNTILDNKILLGYSEIEGEENTIVISPVIKDEYNNMLPQKEVDAFLREFNIYLFTIKQIILNNINVLKNHKIIINVTSEDLLTTTMLVDLLSLIKREDLMAVFNVNINSKYSIVKPLLKQIKSYAQLGFKNIGSGYINFIDIYALKVEYLEIDEKLSELVDKEEEWKFLVDSVKLIIKAQKSKLISSKYKDENIKKISNEIKIL